MLRGLGHRYSALVQFELLNHLILMSRIGGQGKIFKSQNIFVILPKLKVFIGGHNRRVMCVVPFRKKKMHPLST